MTEVVSYNANCHCGRFRYRIDLPKIETATICSCFLCTKMGYMWLSVNADAVTVTRGGDAELTKYKSAVLEHEVCSAIPSWCFYVIIWLQSFAKQIAVLYLLRYRYPWTTLWRATEREASHQCSCNTGTQPLQHQVISQRTTRNEHLLI